MIFNRIICVAFMQHARDNYKLPSVEGPNRREKEPVDEIRPKVGREF